MPISVRILQTRSLFQCVALIVPLATVLNTSSITQTSAFGHPARVTKLCIGTVLLGGSGAVLYAARGSAQRPDQMLSLVTGMMA